MIDLWATTPDQWLKEKLSEFSGITGFTRDSLNWWIVKQMVLEIVEPQISALMSTHERNGILSAAEQQQYVFWSSVLNKLAHE